MSAEALLAAIIAESGVSRYTFTRTLNEFFTDSPASGRATPRDDFVHAGANWRLHQIIPFVGSGIGGPVGDARIQIRNASIGRGLNTLAMMPDRIILANENWNGSPWTFTRGAAASDISNVGGGNQARVAVNYEPDHVPAATPVAAGVARNQEFTITLEWDD